MTRQTPAAPAPPSERDIFTLWASEIQKHGLARVELWPEGLVFWAGGQIRWKSWFPAPPLTADERNEVVRVLKRVPTITDASGTGPWRMCDGCCSKANRDEDIQHDEECWVPPFRALLARLAEPAPDEPRLGEKIPGEEISRLLHSYDKPLNSAGLEGAQKRGDERVASVLRLGDKARFHLGQRVIKTGGDYTFDGWVVSVWRKRSGKLRYCVENEAGLVHIFNEGQLSAYEEK